MQHFEAIAWNLNMELFHYENAIGHRYNEISWNHEIFKP
jgi:hypothetical protein